MTSINLTRVKKLKPINKLEIPPIPETEIKSKISIRGI